MYTRGATFVDINLKASSGTVFEELLPLSKQVGTFACKAEKVVSIGKDTDLVGKAIRSQQAAEVVAPIAQLEPAEKWFQEK